jgi:hypothetical protein
LSALRQTSGWSDRAEVAQARSLFTASAISFAHARISPWSCINGITPCFIWYYRLVRTISLKLPVAIDERLESHARRHGSTKSAITREALQRFLASDRARPASCLDLVRDLVGSARGPGDLSFNKKHLRGYGR